MSNIRDIVHDRILDAIKRYPTTVSDTILEIIASRLEEIYWTTHHFPELINPNQDRYDIMRAMASQYDYDMRVLTPLSEQTSLLESILELYRRRGSYDTIINMRKYYGGDLPEFVTLKIPSEQLFTYSVSELSGRDVFPDGEYNRYGVYEVILYDEYDTSVLREFLLNELVSAGNKLYFSKHLTMYGDTESDKWVKYSEWIIGSPMYVFRYLEIAKFLSGLTYSNISPSQTWSGKRNLFIEITQVFELGPLYLDTFNIVDQLIHVDFFRSITAVYRDWKVNTLLNTWNYDYADYTDYTDESSSEQHLYDSNGNPLDSEYPGFFILGASKLGGAV